MFKLCVLVQARHNMKAQMVKQNKKTFFLTNSDRGNHRRHDHRQRHAASYHQVPLVFGDVFAFIASMNLMGIIVQYDLTSHALQ